MFEYFVNCWNCSGEYDAITAVWCNCDPRNPTKLCPYCLTCFCRADAQFLARFWKEAPQQLIDEKYELNSARGQLGHVLVSMNLITVQQLVDGLAHSKATGKKLGASLIEMGVISEGQIESALDKQMELTGAIRKPPAEASGGEAAAPGDAASASAPAASPHQQAAQPDPLKETLTNLFAQAFKRQASALYFEPSGDEVIVRARIDGNLLPLLSFPSASLPGIMQRAKRMARLNPDEVRIPQSGRFSLKMGEKTFDVILQTLPGPTAEGAGMRVVDRSRLSQDLKTLGFEPSDCARLEKAVDAAQGLIVLSGPLFNAVTETVYSILHRKTAQNRKVVTIESPIATAIPGVNQLEVPEGDGAAHVQGLRSLLNLSPDVVFLNDIPDGETLKAVTRIASTVQVFASLDCSSTFQVLDRLRSLDTGFSQTLTVLQLVVSQRLIRRICTHCVERKPITLAMTNEMGLDRDEMHLTPEVATGRGCAACHDLGYSGSKILYETLTMDADIRAIALANGPQEELEQAAAKQGFNPLRLLHLREVAKLTSSPEEFIRGSYPRPLFKRIFRVK